MGCYFSKHPKHEEDALGDPSTTATAAGNSATVPSSAVGGGGARSQSTDGSGTQSQGTKPGGGRPGQSSSGGGGVPSQSNNADVGAPSQSSNRGRGPSQGNNEGGAPSRSSNGGRDRRPSNNQGGTPSDNPDGGARPSESATEGDEDHKHLEAALCTKCFEPFDDKEKTRAFIQPCGDTKVCLPCALESYEDNKECPVCKIQISCKPSYARPFPWLQGLPPLIIPALYIRKT